MLTWQCCIGNVFSLVLGILYAQTNIRTLVENKSKLQASSFNISKKTADQCGTSLCVGQIEINTYLMA